MLFQTLQLDVEWCPFSETRALLRLLCSVIHVFAALLIFLVASTTRREIWCRIFSTSMNETHDSELLLTKKKFMKVDVGYRNMNYVLLLLPRILSRKSKPSSYNFLQFQSFESKVYLVCMKWVQASSNLRWSFISTLKWVLSSLYKLQSPLW